MTQAPLGQEAILPAFDPLFIRSSQSREPGIVSTAVSAWHCERRCERHMLSAQIFSPGPGSLPARPEALRGCWARGLPDSRPLSHGRTSGSRSLDAGLPPGHLETSVSLDTQTSRAPFP